MTRDYNPQAFPMPASEHSQGGHHEQNGMDLRDWFAGKIVAGWCANPSDGFNGPYENMAREAYQLADAMLAERAKGGER